MATHKEIFERYLYAGAITRNPDAIAALFTEDARMSDEAGKTVEGRAAIQKRLEESFKKSPGAKLTLKTASVKFLSGDVAVEEGSSRVEAPNADQAWRRRSSTRRSGSSRPRR